MTYFRDNRTANSLDAFRGLFRQFSQTNEVDVITVRANCVRFETAGRWWLGWQRVRRGRSAANRPGEVREGGSRGCVGRQGSSLALDAFLVAFFSGR